MLTKIVILPTSTNSIPYKLNFIYELYRSYSESTTWTSQDHLNLLYTTVTILPVGLLTMTNMKEGRPYYSVITLY